MGSRYQSPDVYSEFEETPEFFDEIEQSEYESQLEPESEWEEETPQRGTTGRKLFVHPSLGVGWLGESDYEADSEDEWETEEEIIGKTDSRSPVRDTQRAPCRWICHLLVKFRHKKMPGGVGTFVGTGTLISPRHVVTAAHNLFNFDLPGMGGTGLEVSEVIVTPGKDRAKSPFGRTTVAANGIFVTDEWRKSQDHKLDFGLIKLKDAMGSAKQKALRNKALGFWGSDDLGEGTTINIEDPANLKDKKIMMAGYPTDKCGYDAMLKLKDSKACAYPPADWETSLSKHVVKCIKEGLHATAMFGDSGKVIDAAPSKATQYLLHDMDTCKGNSGGPIWIHSGKTRNMIAIHTGPSPWDDTSNRSIRLTKKVKDQVLTWMK